MGASSVITTSANGAMARQFIGNDGQAWPRSITSIAAVNHPPIGAEGTSPLAELIRAFDAAFEFHLQTSCPDDYFDTDDANFDAVSTISEEAEAAKDAAWGALADYEPADLTELAEKARAVLHKRFCESEDAADFAFLANDALRLTRSIEVAPAASIEAAAAAEVAAFAALTKQLEALTALEKVAVATSDDTGDKACSASREIAEAIMAAPATTLAGYAAKVRAVAWCWGGEGIDDVAAYLMESGGGATGSEFLARLIKDLAAQPVAL